MKHDDKQDPRNSRRAFIGGALTAGAGAAVVAIVPAEALSADSGKEQQPQQKGYQLTEHVLDYYRSAAE